MCHLEMIAMWGGLKAPLCLYGYCIRMSACLHTLQGLFLYVRNIYAFGFNLSAFLSHFADFFVDVCLYAYRTAILGKAG